MKSRSEEFYKKGVHKYSTKFTRKHLRRDLFCKACNFIKHRIWHRCFPVNFEKSLRPSFLQNVCEGLLLKSKILIGVSFRKVLGFYYKRSRQLFYYGGTSSYIHLQIPKRVNKVIFQNSSELLLPKIPQQTKTCVKSTKECFRYPYSGVLIISLESIFEVCDGVWFFANLQVFT